MTRSFLPRPSRLARRVAIAAGLVGLVAVIAPLRAAVALAPVDDRQGDRRAALVVREVLRAELEAETELIDPVRLRDAQRRFRIRSIDDATTAELRELGRATGADRIVTIAVHQAMRELVPRITLSGRAYAAESGELLWAGFESSSGLDGRKLLGLGVIDELDELAARASRRLAEDFLGALAGRGEASPGRRGSGPGRLAATLGRVAVLPVGAIVEQGGTNAAETVTEALRAVLFQEGVELVAPNRVAALLRRLRSKRWGGAEATVRRELGSALEVDRILTGSVERFELGGALSEPEPRVAVGLRLLDATSGRIVWTGARERSGWDGQGPFHLGRVYACGDLTERIMRDLVRDLLRDTARHATSERLTAAVDSGRSGG